MHFTWETFQRNTLHGNHIMQDDKTETDPGEPQSRMLLSKFNNLNRA